MITKKKQKTAETKGEKITKILQTINKEQELKDNTGKEKSKNIMICFLKFWFRNFKIEIDKTFFCFTYRHLCPHCIKALSISFSVLYIRHRQCVQGFTTQHAPTPAFSLKQIMQSGARAHGTCIEI